METQSPSPNGAPTRLVIKEMVLENFKSYAGAQKVGPFHKCFSSVVGPNGSGKSNVIDGLLFVFGRRAKQLRFNKVSELIHNSTNHRNLQQAKVSVHFVNIVDKDGDDFDIVPGSDLIVSRTATRQNQSDYYINDRRVPVKEVTTLLKGKGIDLDNNRFLILQGEVEQISMMKPKGEEKTDTGLLEYLEDIIGTHTYIPLIETAHKRLEELNDERQKAVGQMKAVERQVEGLEGARQQAEAYLAKQVQRAQLAIKGYQLTSRVNELRIEEGEATAGKLRGQLEHETGKLAGFEAEMKGLEKALKAAEKELAQVAKEQEKCAAEFSKYECKDAEGQTNLQHLAQQADKLRAKIATDNKKLQKLEKECGEMEAAIPKAGQDAERLTESLAAAQKVLDEMLEGIRGEVEGYRQDLSKVKGQLAPWEEQMQEVQSRIDVATTERDLLLRQQQDAAGAYQDAVQGASAAREAAAAKRAEITGMQASLKQLKLDVEAHRKKLAGSQQEEERCQEAVRQLRGAVEQSRQEANSQQTKGQALKALLEARASGAIPGLYGRLGDLGAVDAKYDVAVSTAAGALDYIVVESDEDARKGVELLRQRALGRLTFLIRNKQEHLRGEAGQRVDTPEGAPRLFDLVKFQDEKLRVAFFFAFRNTLVAPDLAAASAIGYAKNSRFRRVVTLQGQLIESSGTMSGGGSQPKKGAMCLGKSAPKAVDPSVSAAELQRLQQQLERAQQELQAAQAAVRAAAAAVKEAEGG